jgi:hypothetical protein
VRVTHKGTSLSGNQQWVSILVSGSAIPLVDFRITSFIQQPDGSFIITWNAVVGGIYRVQGTQDFVNWTDVSGDISANQESMSMLIPNPGVPYSFYRVARFY